MNYGFVRVAAAVPAVKVADCGYNAGNIVELIFEAEEKGVQFVVFPELSVTAYTCGDLFQQKALLKGAEEQLACILSETKNTRTVAVVGMPVYADSQLFNCGIAIQSGHIIGAVPKTYIPGYSEFYEERWFSPGTKALSKTVKLCGQEVPFGADLLFEADNMPEMRFGIELCEDLWTPLPPSSYQAVVGAVLIFNLSASNEIVGKYEYRRELVKQQSARCISGYVFTSAGIGESTTDVVFGGHAVIAEYGTVLAEAERFKSGSQFVIADVDVEKLASDRLKNTSFMEGACRNDYRIVKFQTGDFKAGKLERYIDPHPFVPSNAESRDIRCREIFEIQTSGLGKRIGHIGLKHAVIAISGGLDSTLALLVTASTFDKLGLPRENIVAITMPGFGTTDETYANAMNFMKSMKVTILEIDIKPACLQHFKDIGHDPSVHDLTYENSQARERMQIPMDVASRYNGLVVGTGDLSELALGWCTYNGDHMSMYSVNSGVPKTLVKYLVQWVADNISDGATREVLYRIIDTPISPELLPPDDKGGISQRTEDIVGPYELHDFFIYHALRYGAPPDKIFFLACSAFEGRYEADVIGKWLKSFYRRFFSQQFKRSCLPDGPKVGTISLSPRGDWRMPSDASAAVWLKQLEKVIG